MRGCRSRRGSRGNGACHFGRTLTLRAVRARRPQMVIAIAERRVDRNSSSNFAVSGRYATAVRMLSGCAGAFARARIACHGSQVLRTEATCRSHALRISRPIGSGAPHGSTAGNVHPQRCAVCERLCFANSPDRQISCGRQSLTSDAELWITLRCTSGPFWRKRSSRGWLPVP